MKFEVYCDENHQDVLTSANAGGVASYLTIGSLWLPAELREDVKQKISQLREQHNKHGEIKWSKVSPSSLDFHKSLIDLYISYGAEMRFRCIAVKASDINWNLHNGDKELGFYKFYYQLLQHWILAFNEYRIFCDYKTNKKRDELHVLKQCLNNANLSSDITQVQALSSKNVVLIQLSDLLLGAASARMNNTVQEGGAKDELIGHLETRLNIECLGATPKGEQKFNIFKINLKGGW